MNKTLSKQCLTFLLSAGFICACSQNPSQTAGSKDANNLAGADVITAKNPLDGTGTTIISKKESDGSETDVIKADYGNGTQIDLKFSEGKDGSFPVMNVKTKDGVTVSSDPMGREGVEFSPNFPLKQYPGSKCTECSASPDPKAPYVSAEISTTDPIDKVDQFYRDELKSEGWKIVSEISNDKMDKTTNPTHLMLTGQKDTREAKVMIMDPAEGSNAVGIMMNVSQRN